MTTPTTPVNRLRPRRSCLAVPGSNPRFLEKAQGLPADPGLLDPADAGAPRPPRGAGLSTGSPTSASCEDTPETRVE
ncbi:hypothetical protein ACFWJY_19060, partial [Streptomyces anulatus]